MTEKREATVTEDFIFGEWMLDEMEAQGISVVQLSKIVFVDDDEIISKKSKSAE